MPPAPQAVTLLQPSNAVTNVTVIPLVSAISNMMGYPLKVRVARRGWLTGSGSRSCWAVGHTDTGRLLPECHPSCRWVSLTEARLAHTAGTRKHEHRACV